MGFDVFWPAQHIVISLSFHFTHIIRTRIIGPCASTFDSPLLVKSGLLFTFFVSERQLCGMSFALCLELEILDYPAHGLIIRVLTVKP